LLTHIEAGVANPSYHKRAGEERRSGVSHLVGYRENNSGQEKLEQCAGTLIGEAEKYRNQANKAGNRYKVKKSDHLISITIGATMGASKN
jgi:hypothetical protein